MVEEVGSPPSASITKKEAPAKASPAHGAQARTSNRQLKNIRKAAKREQKAAYEAAFPDQPWLLVARPLGAFVIAVLLSLLLVQLPETQLLEHALLSERRMSQPLSTVGLLERSGGLVGDPIRELTPTQSTRLRATDVLEQSSREFLDLLALLVLGCLIAALVQTWLPRSWLLAVGGAPTGSILALMLLAVVVSVCSSVDAFLALGFCSTGHPRCTVGVPPAGAGRRPKTGRPVHCFDASPRHCNHGRCRQLWSAPHWPMGQSLAAMRVTP